MTKVILTIFLTFLTTLLYAQSKKSAEGTIADCSGALNIFKSGSYTLQFTGSTGNNRELENYPSLKELGDENLIWISYIAEDDGVLSFDATIGQDYLQMVVFQEMTSNICVELPRGIAEIKRIHQQKGQSAVGLNRTTSAGFLYPIELMAGQKVVICFSTLPKSKAFIKLNFKFQENENAAKALNETKIIDNRDDEFAPSLSIMVRDAESDEPIIANITIEGPKDLAALYKGSDVFCNVSRPCKVAIKCDAEGYFFIDSEENLIATSNQEILLKMERISVGKSMQIEEIEFKPGTSEFMPGSDGKLRRLKDFMALNADIQIEIQGHVHTDKTDDNHFASQKLSEARAKRVMIYLTEHGISRERMTAVGYGNSKPIYPDA
ncbi:MAG: OmpA family protein, partial [Flavobacteriia bacterium]